jgi:dolichol-phosphate mannosyltransferase
MSGFFMLRRSVVDGVGLSSRGFKVLLEILVKGRYGSVVEVPYVFKPRRRGESKLSLKEIIFYSLLLLRLKLGIRT